MANDLDVKALVQFILDAKGLTDASKQLSSLETKVKGLETASRAAATSTSSNFGAAFAQVGSMAVRYLAPVAIFGFLARQASEFEKFQKSVRATGYALEAMGISAAETLPRVLSFLEALSRATGIVDDETLPAFQKLVGITGNVDAALGGVKLAAGIARSGLMEYSQAADTVASILAGRFNERVKDLGVNIRDANGEIKTAVEVITELQAKYGQLSDTSTQAASGTARLSDAWDRFTDLLSSYFLPVMDATKKSLTWFLDNLSIGIERNVYRLGAGLAALANWMSLLQWDAAAKKAEEWGLAVDGVGKQAAGATEDVKKLSAALDEAAALRDRESEKAAQDEKLKATISAEQKLLQSRIELAEKGSRQRLNLELGLLEFQWLQERKGAISNADALSRIDEAYANTKRARIDAFNQEQTDKAKKAAEARTKAEQQAGLDALRSQRDLAEEGTLDRLVMTDRVMQAEMEAELAGTEKTEREKQAIRERYGNQRIAAEQAFLDQVYQKLLEGLEKEAEILQKRNDMEEAAREELLQIRAAELDDQLQQLIGFGQFFTDEQAKQAYDAIEQRKIIEDEAALDRYRAELGAAIAIGADTFAVTMKYLKRTEQAEKASAEARKKIEMQVALSNIHWAQFAAQMFSVIGGMVFGENKKFKAAMALMDGILAGMESFYSMGGPVNPAAWAALALGIATGVAQAAAIMKTQPGSTSASSSGGGGGGGGGTSSAGGTVGRSVPQESRAAASTPPSQPATSVVNDQSTGQVIHVHGSFIDSDSLRGLSRKLAQTNRDDQARFQR